MALRDVPHIGPLVAGRLRDIYGVETQAQYAQLVGGIAAQAHGARRGLLQLVQRVTANPRACACLEGYVARRYNAHAYDALVGLMAGAVAPGLLPPFAGAVRGPPEPAPPYSAGLVARDGPAYPRGRDDYGHANPLRGAAGAAARDAILAGAPAAVRASWPCACFQREETCTDFSEARENRAAGGPPPCAWTGARCVSAPAGRGAGGAGRGAARGVGRGMVPGAGRGAAPGVGRGAVPGIGRGAAPGVGRGAVPGVGRGAALGVGWGAAPGAGPAPEAGGGGAAGRGVVHAEGARRGRRARGQGATRYSLRQQGRAPR